MTTLFGVIHGKTIELEQEPDWPEGERVAVTIQHAVTSNTGSIPGVEQWAGRLVFDSTISPTERIVKGTRLPAEMLVAELKKGFHDDQMLETHPELTREDLAALRAYAEAPIGIRRSFGGWAEDAEELDEFLEWNRQRRKLSRREVK
jgi:uncharacterized protein (DUF433 family)